MTDFKEFFEKLEEELDDNRHNTDVARIRKNIVEIFKVLYQDWEFKDQIDNSIFNWYSSNKSVISLDMKTVIDDTIWSVDYNGIRNVEIESQRQCDAHLKLLIALKEKTDKIISEENNEDKAHLISAIKNLIPDSVVEEWHRHVFLEASYLIKNGDIDGANSIIKSHLFPLFYCDN